MQSLHVGQSVLAGSLPGLAQHLLRQIDAGDAFVLIIVRQRQPRPDADLQHIRARETVGQGNRAQPALGRYAAEHGVINSRPAPVRLHDRGMIQRRYRHQPPSTSRWVLFPENLIHPLQASF